MSSLAVQEVNFTEQKELREKYVEKIEVLDKVKTLFLIPRLEAVTTQMVADYFEVGLEAIQSCYKRNLKEIDSDGVISKKAGEIRKFLLVRNEQEEKLQGRSIVFLNNVKINIPNAGTKVFSKRAILRIAMLLRDSEVAKEIRTQLLNIFEHSTVEQEIVELDNEQYLLINLAESYVVKDFDDFAIANQNYIGYQSRYIKQIENDKKLLTGEILKWENRASLVNAIRILSGQSQKYIGCMFNELYAELSYK